MWGIPITYAGNKDVELGLKRISKPTFIRNAYKDYDFISAEELNKFAC